MSAVQLSVGIPMYSCATCLHALHERLTRTLEAMGVDDELVFVDDRARDGSWDVSHSSRRPTGASAPCACRATSASTSGSSSARGVRVTWFAYAGYPAYAQPHGPSGHHVSVIDLLCCAGRDSRRLLQRATPQVATGT